METLFKLQEHGVTVRNELVAGITTFLTMAYILAVNPIMLGAVGNGMTPEAVFTATALSAGIATVVMAFAANLPIALAPGMRLNAFFTYTVVFNLGYPWQTALTAVFLEGILFLLLSFFNVRETIVKAIPGNLKKAVAAGIGLFISLIGFENAGLVVGDPVTLVKLGNVMSGGAVVAILGMVIVFVLYAYRIPGAILIGILFGTLIGIPFGVTLIPVNFSPISLPAAPLFCKFDFSSILTFRFFTVFFTFLFVDIFDTVGALVGLTSQAGLIKKNGDIPHLKQAFLADAAGTVAGAALGTSTVTSYMESAAGIVAGGRTGLTALSSAVLFFMALFLSPLFLIIPNAATAPALVLIGFLMIRSVADIDFKDPTEGIPAFLTMVIMPFAYSIAEGIVYGILSYVALKAFTQKFKDITAVTWIIFGVFILRFMLQWEQ